MLRDYRWAVEAMDTKSTLKVEDLAVLKYRYRYWVSGSFGRIRGNRMLQATCPGDEVNGIIVAIKAIITRSIANAIIIGSSAATYRSAPPCLS